MKGLAEFVKHRRKEVKLTQEEFAERSGVALTVISALSVLTLNQFKQRI